MAAIKLTTRRIQPQLQLDELRLALFSAAIPFGSRQTKPVEMDNPSNLDADFECDDSQHLDKAAEAWRALYDKAKEETSGVLRDLLDYNEDPDTGVLNLSQHDTFEGQKDSADFLLHWHMQAKKVLVKGAASLSAADWEDDFCMGLESNQHCQRPFVAAPKKYLMLLSSFIPHSGKSAKHNYDAVLRFFQNQKPMISHAGIAEEVKSCELNIQIQEYAAKMLPEYKALRDKAVSEVARYNELLEGHELQELRRSTERFSERISALHPNQSDWAENDVQRKRFLTFKVLLEKMIKFVDCAIQCRSSTFFLSRIMQVVDKDAKPDKNPSIFLKAVFNLISIFFVVIADVNSKCPPPQIGPVTASTWKAFAYDLETNAEEVRNRLATAANEAATRWLLTDVSAICHDICLETAQHDSSTRIPNSELPPKAPNSANINRQEYLAVDMHPECQDLIGMRVWYVDSVPTGGFNQFLPAKRYTCGLIIVHVFLRYNIAISRLRDQPEKMQAPVSARTNVACGNIQLPSWVQDACVDRLFYQPLLDFLIHDFSLSFEEDREPARLVFTGAAFDAVLATVVASELISRFNSYREDRLIKKRHSHTTVDWDVLYNHIKSSVFVLSFMLPAVFSGPHLSPDQMIAKKGNKDKLHTPHGAVGINMINITISNCVAFKLVEHWLSVDRSELAKNHDEWKVYSSFDKKVLETLQKLFSSCKKTAQFRDFEKTIEQAVDEVKRWAKSTDANKRQLGTFVADYKAKGVSAVKPPVRLINSPRVASSQTVQQKTQDEALGQKLGHALTGFFQQIQQTSGDWWLGCLSLIKEPFQLLSCSHPLPQATEKSRGVMVRIASWFLPIAAVYEVSQPKIDSAPFPQRKVASYGTCNASDLPINEHAYTTYGFEKDSSMHNGIPEANSRTQHASNFAMCSRMLVKPIGNNDRLLIQWKCDSMDSHALIRNCYAVTFTVCFEPDKTSDVYDIQTEEVSSSGFRVTVTENDYESLYSLHCEAEIPIPRNYKQPTFEILINKTVIFVTLRMRFFSAQFGWFERERVSTPFTACYGPELFCFPKRIALPQPNRGFNDALLVWVWFYLARFEGSLEMMKSMVNSCSGDEILRMLLQNLGQKSHTTMEAFWASGSGCPPLVHFRKVLKLDNFYKRHKFCYEGKFSTAFDFTFCEFEILRAQEKSYNSRYLYMRLDELIMQAWDFKLLALNAFGNSECLKSCKFPECDALIQDFDEQADLIATRFRGSMSSPKLSKRCEACHAMGVKKERSSCKNHMYDYLNDDEEGLEYLRKQSSYLRRLTFSKITFKQISSLFTELQRHGGQPNQRFYQSIADCIGTSPDAHSLMVKLVSSPSEGNPNATMMTQRSYDGIYNAFFNFSIEPRTFLETGKEKDMSPKFPINLYDNEKYMLAQSQDYRQFPTAVSTASKGPEKEKEQSVPACSLVSRRSHNFHHFGSLFRVLETGLQAGWNSQRTEAEFTSWAHAMGVLRSFAIRKEFEAFCGFFQNAKERRSVLSWLHTGSESADPYLDCLQEIHTIFCDSADNSAHTNLARDDYYAHEERIITLIVRHEKCGYGSRAEFKKEMMNKHGRKSFQQRVSFLPGVCSLERLAKFLFFRESNFWASWVTTFVCFLSHIHELREWLMINKRCVAAFGDQKVGKSRFWSNSLGIDTNPSSQSNTVQTQMWMLPHSQFIDFPAFSEENKLGESYNFELSKRCDIMARHIVLDFLLVPDICVYIVKTISPNTESIKKLIAHILELETDRYPTSIGTDDDNGLPGDEVDSYLPRTRSAASGQALRTVVHNRLARESVLLCSHTQNFICRLEPVNLGVFSKSLSFDPKLLSVDKGNLSSEHLKEIGNHPELKKSKFVWVCGASDEGHAVKIVEKINAEGKPRWQVVGKPSSDPRVLQPANIWEQLRAKLLKKKSEIGEMFSSKNVFLAYFAEYATEFNSPFDLDVVNHIEEDFPWSSAFCASTKNPEQGALFQPPPDMDASLEDLPILNASECLKMILKKLFTSSQLNASRMNDVFDEILVKPIPILKSLEKRPEQLVSTRICDDCARDSEIDDDERLHADHLCVECNLFMCVNHAELHKKRKKTSHHTVNEIVDRDAEERHLAEFASALRIRDEEEKRHTNSYSNRQHREKIWKIRQKEVRLSGKVLINKMCGDNQSIDSVLKSLQILQASLEFDESFFQGTSEKLKDTKCGLGLAFWSFVLGDSEDSDGHVFSMEKIHCRSLGVATVTALREKKQKTHPSFVASPRLSITPRPSINLDFDITEDVFIIEADKLWAAVRDGGTSCKTIIASIRERVEFHQKLSSRDSVGGGSVTAVSSPSSFHQMVPWFSGLFFAMLQEGDCLDSNLFSHQFFEDSKQIKVASQEFCLALLKVILLPLLASKKNSDIRPLLQYGVAGDEFCLSFYHVEQAMLDCVSPVFGHSGQSLPLESLLQIKSATEDHSSVCIKALGLLIRSISVQGLIELSKFECLDFQPCIASLICENLHATLCESRSVFAQENSLIFSSSNQETKQRSLRLLTDSVLSSFDKLEQCVLKPLLEIEQKIGKHFKQVSRIAVEQDLEKVFDCSRIFTQQFNEVKELMRAMVDGSLAAVTVTMSASLLNDLENCQLGDESYRDIPLMGRAVLHCEDKDVVSCYLTDPCFSFFACKLVCSSFRSDTKIEKEMQFLRISLPKLRSMNIHKIPVGGKFTLIVDNCSTVFLEELHVSDKHLSPFVVSSRDVSWVDFSYDSAHSEDPGSRPPLPFRDCSVELEPIVQDVSGATHSKQLWSTGPSLGCIVGQRVTMSISFRHTQPWSSSPSRIFVVLDDEFECHEPYIVTILPYKREAKYTITEITVADKGKYRLMEVPFHFIPEGTKIEDRVTLSFKATNPSHERLYRGACFVFLRTHMYQSSQPPSHFSLEASKRGHLDFGLARIPIIYRAPLQHCEILISKACLGEKAVDLMLTFECSIGFLVYDPDSDKNSVVEIDLPQSWSMKLHKKDAQLGLPPQAALGVPKVQVQSDFVPQPVTMRCESADGIFADLQAELYEFSNTKISVKIKPHQDIQSREKITLKQNSKLAIIVSGVALPMPPPDLNQALLNVKEANERVARDGQSQSEYELHKSDVDDAVSKLNALNEFLTSGCNVTIKDVSECIVMTGRNVPMSPLLESGQYATVIERKTFENSEYLKAHDGAAGKMPWGFHEGQFWTKLTMFMDAFVIQKYQGNSSIINSEKTQSAINSWCRAVSEALSQKRVKVIIKQLETQGLLKSDDQHQDYDLVSRAAAMAVQLWSSDISLELDNQRFCFFQIINRFALSEDSKELFEAGGISLIKAIKRNIVTDRTKPPHTQSATAGGAAAKTNSRGEAATDAFLPKRVPVAPRQVQVEEFFRGGSVPFEMAGFFFPGKIFKFPVFVATSCNCGVAIDFALKVTEKERTLWKFSAPDDCMHFKALRENALLPHEEEFLFPPYSAFKVKSNRMEQLEYRGQIVQLRIICLEALSDNKDKKAQNVPTAPRY